MRRIALMLLALAAPLAAQTTHPDFSGKWNLDAAASGAPAGVTAQLTITQDAKGLKMEQAVTSPMGAQNVTLNYVFEGPSKNSINTPMGGVDLNSTLTWNGATLVVKSNANVNGTSLDQTDNWSLSADGKTLTMESNISAAGQSMSRKQVFTKG